MTPAAAPAGLSAGPGGLVSRRRCLLPPCRLSSCVTMRHMLSIGLRSLSHMVAGRWGLEVGTKDYWKFFAAEQSCVSLTVALSNGQSGQSS